jgi:hypothetical protein
VECPPAQTWGLLPHLEISRVCSIWVGLVAALWGTPHPKTQFVHPPRLRTPGKSQIGGSVDRFEPDRWSAMRVGFVSAGFSP